MRQDPPAVILGGDTDAWRNDDTAWRRQLRLMRQLSVAGVRCFRLPRERLTDPGRAPACAGTNEADRRLRAAPASNPWDAVDRVVATLGA